MAKCIYICSRETLPAATEKKLQVICSRLSPDNIVLPAPRIVINDTVAYAIVNPAETLMESASSLLVGKIFGEAGKWYEPLEIFPDGSFALFRNSNESCEIVSDVVASRTIWYFHDDHIFAASTSQRAIAMFIGAFEFDERVIPWMLSTGSLGPDLSWDKRIKRVPPDSSVALDKRNWSLSIKAGTVEFKMVRRPDREHRRLLEESLKAAFTALQLDYSHWLLPLSGGYDSRGVLCLLAENSNIDTLRTVTWGLESSQTIKHNDAYIAKELARAFRVSNKYYHTDVSEEPIERVVDRFVMMGEGRIDHLSGYMDGFRIWKTLAEDGITGIIRGDEGFGWEKVSSELDVRISLGCGLCSDAANLHDYQKYGLARQAMPQHLCRAKAETLAQWRDRLYHEYRLPTVLAALTDLKLCYVEQINPLLSRKIVQQVRQLPDHLRTQKVLFKKIVSSKSPKIGFAKSSALSSPGDILKQKAAVELLRKELHSDHARKLFPAAFLDSVLADIKTETKQKSGSKSALKSFMKRNLPHFLKVALKKASPRKIDPNVLAFRVFLVSKMNRVLNEDAHCE